MSDAVSYVLPVPPSANRLWRAANGRVCRSREYRLWLGEAGTVILFAGRCCVPSPVAVSIALYGVPVGSDLDNRIKACLDLLRHAHVIGGDSVGHVRRIEAEYCGTDEMGPRAVVTVRPFEAVPGEG